MSASPYVVYTDAIYRRYRLTINLLADKQRCAGYLDSLYLYTVNKHMARRSDKDTSGPD